MGRGSTTGLVMICVGLLAALAVAAGVWFAIRPTQITASPTTLDSAAGAATQSPASTPSELIIAVEDAADPWSRADGTGCANDIVVAAYRAVSVSVKWKVNPYARAKAQVMNGEVVACVSMSWAPELEGKVIFADKDKPLFVFHSTYVRKLGVPLKGDSEKTLPAGTIVGTVLNYENPPTVDAMKDRGVILEAANSEVMNLNKLMMERIDLAIINTDELKTVECVFAKAGVTDKVGVAFTGESLPGYIGFSVVHPQSEFARAKFNRGFGIIASNGTLEKIRAQWRGK